MRELKFRAWDKKDKKMIFEFPYDNLKVEHFYVRCEVMQCTGLKDKNGKEIYEGDILRPVKPSPKEGNRVVIFLDGSFCYNESRVRGNRGYWPLTTPKAKLFEVIGNEFENPELLQ